jgi:sugar lactone lactonase YvrE
LKETTMKLLAIGWLGILTLALASPARAAAGDTIADRVLGQRRFGTAIPYFVDGTALDAADIAFDRSAVPNRVYVASPDLNRVLGWSDLGRFRAGAPADLVLGQPSVYNGSYAYSYLRCPAPPSATTFCAPDRVAVDPAGNLYVVDAYNFRVLEFDRPFATDRVADRVFGQASFTARTLPALLPLNFPADLAVDGQGNLWVIDPAGTRRILEYDAPVSRGKGPVPAPDRIIAAAMEAACWNGTPARPCSPFSLEFSPQGDLYVVDFTGKSSRQLIYQLPLKTDLKADFTLARAPGSYFQQPGVFDAAGNLVFLASGQVWRYAAPIGPGTQPEVLSPPLDLGLLAQLALDSRGNLYVASYPSAGHDNFVYVVDTPFQAAPARLGSERETNRGLAMPDILAIDRSASPNHLYAVDADNRILGWRDAEGFANGAAADLVLGGSFHGSRHNRGGLAVDSHGNLWVADAANHRVLELDRPFESDGVADRVLGQGGSFTSSICNLGGVSARSLCSPGALAFDRQDHLYVADLENHRVLLFAHPETDDAAAKVFGQADFTQALCNRGRLNPGAATLCLGGFAGDYPVFFGNSSLAVDPQGNLYVVDSINNRVLIYRDPLTSDATGAVADVVIGQDDFKQKLRGTGPRRFSGLLAVAVGPRGELYVADSGNDRVLEFRNPLRDTLADRVFGHADFATGGVPNLPPPATAANLLTPRAVAVDALGNLYIADTGHDRVLEYDKP